MIVSLTYRNYREYFDWNLCMFGDAWWPVCWCHRGRVYDGDFVPFTIWDNNSFRCAQRLPQPSLS